MKNSGIFLETIRLMKSTSKRRRKIGLMAGAAAVMVSSAGVAQQEAQNPTAAQMIERQAAALSLPEITVYGNQDPNVYKATAIVNGDIVTDTDVDQRLALVVLANGGEISAEERQLLRLQVLRNLIDEMLQIQEARDNKIDISDAEIEQAYARVAHNFQQSPKEFDTFLRTNHSSPASMKQQIRAEVAWQRVLGSKVQPFVNVGDDEVRSILRKLEQSKGQEEYRVGEIFLSAPAEQIPATMQEAARIVDQVRKGASFVAYARQFSEASTAAVGGDLGWVQLAQLSPPLAQAVSQLERGMVSDPVAVPGGVAIVALINKRQVLAGDPEDAILSLKQMTLPLRAGITEGEARKLAAGMQEKTAAMGGCGRADEVARDIGASIVSNDQIRLGDLPPQLQQILSTMQIGTATPPFGSAEEGLRVLVLCGRDDPAVDGRLPSFDDVYGQLTDQRVNSAARRLLRDLRRDAVVEYR